MPDLFQAKATNWDASQMRQQLSSAIGSTIVQQVSLDTEMHVMDFGAGTGLLTAAIAPQVSHITAVDTSAAMLDKLMIKSELDGKVSVVCQDIIDQPLETKFDLIISAMAMHHVENTDRLIATFSTHLRPGGRIALADLDKEDGTFHPADTEGVFHHGFERGDLQRILEGRGFVDVQFETAHTVDKEDKRFPIFLVTARKRGESY
jgi:2-polyprenyl-3-methyl-5-hydroxy-6-metoxy-1,4-benzoquinol methylase